MERKLRLWVLLHAIFINNKQKLHLETVYGLWIYYYIDVWWFIHHKTINHKILTKNNNRFIYILRHGKIWDIVSTKSINTQWLIFEAWSWYQEIYAFLLHTLCNVCPQGTVISHTRAHTHAHTHWSPFWERSWSGVCMETFQPCDLIAIPNQRWEDVRCCVPSAAHPQLKEMMCMNGRVVGSAASSPNSPHPPNTNPACTLPLGR